MPHSKYNSILTDVIIDKMRLDPNYPLVKKGGATDEEIKQHRKLRIADDPTIKH